MGWARYRSGLLFITLAPILLLVFLFSLNPEMNDSLSSGECTDYLGGCFTSADNAASTDSPPAEEFQDVETYLNESGDSSDSESGTEVLPEENITEELPEPEPAPPEQNETGEFQEVDDYLNETVSDESSNETTDEFVEVEEFLNETSAPEENETGGFFSNETFSDLFSTNETEPIENETIIVIENETSLINETTELNESLLVNETILNETLPLEEIPEGDAVIGDLIYAKNGKPIKADVRLKAQGKDRETYEKENGKEKFHVPKGKYTLTIIPEGQIIQEITIKNFRIDADVSGLVSLDEPDEGSVPGPLGTRFREIYVFNPQADISGTFTVRATASRVYKCKDWNFDLRVCEGEWENILNVTPGEYYTVNFNSSDPAYGEGGGYFTLANITLDGSFDDWAAVFANPHNVMPDGTSGIDDLDVVGTPNRDLIRYAFTWDGDYFYSYFRRTSAGTNVVQMLLYIDVKNDGALGSDDYVIMYSWQNNQNTYVYLYNYTPAIVGGDPITGDGQDENGTISNVVTLETLLPGRDTAGIQMESRFNWSAIGLVPGQPFGLHVSTAQGAGTNLPSQVEDNANGISTMAVEVDISPDHSGAGDNGMTLDYNHTVTNLGNQPDPISISTSGTIPTFTVNITYANGTPLSDTNNDSLVDVGPLAPGASVNITLHLGISGASSGDVDETQVIATSANKTSVSDSALDTTYIGALIIFPDREGSVFNGSRIYYNHTVFSNMIGSNAVAINATSNSSYVVNLTYLNGTPLTDTDSDGKIDIGNLTQGESKTILAWITIPGAATIGTVDDTEITALKATDPSVNATVNDITTVSKAVTIVPNRAGYVSVGANGYVFYEHTVTNNQNFSDVIDLSYNSSLNWNISFYESDAMTPLTDNDGDGMIDVGNLSAFGGATTFYVKVKHAGSLSNGTVDTTNITANSSVYSWAWDRVTDTTTARILITYKEEFHTTFSDDFNKTETVYANAYGLSGYTNVYYVWYDSGDALLRTSPSLAVDANYEAQDKLPLNETLPSGTYIVYVRDSADDSLVDLHQFNVFGILSVQVLSPNGGEIWEGNETILYNITDRSGNNVTTTVQYSPDGGSSWFNITTLQLNTTACSFDPMQQCVEGIFNYTWDTATVSDGDNYLIRVIANDNSSIQSDRSDSTFIIDNAGAYDPNDGIMVYRSNTGSCATNLLNCPKMKSWDAAENGTWGAEMELPTAGSPVRWAVIKRAPLSDKAVIVTLSDDGWLDAYVCMERCTNVSGWNVTNNIGSVGNAPAQRRFDLEFETSTGNLVLVYGVNSTSSDRDLAYKILPANSSNFSGLTEYYINDTETGDLVYTWVRMDRKPTLSTELALVSFDSTSSDINAWIWNGTAWGSQTSITDAATATGGYEALAVKYAYDGSKALAMGGHSGGGVQSRRIYYSYWNGTAWSTPAFIRPANGEGETQWINIKADPSSGDDLQAVLVTSTYRLYTSYWDGSTMTLLGTAIDTAIDSMATRPADFEWNNTGSVGRVVWDTDTAGTTLSFKNCTPQCTATTQTISNYDGTGAWITMYRHPENIGTVKILSARLNSNNDIGSFLFDGAKFANYGDSNITADTTATTYEAYSIAFRTREMTPPVINFTYPTPPNGTVLYVNYTFINTTITDNLNVSVVYLEWNGVNESMNLSGTTNWFKNKTDLASGTYTYKVWASDISGNWAVTETRTVYYGSPPLVFVINPLGEAYGDRRPVPLVINATDPDGINFTSATVTYPNGSTRNITLYNQITGDNFNINTIGINWVTEETAVGPSQTCTANIDTTIPGEAYVSLSGDGSPLTDSLCTIISKSSFYGDFDMNISFQIRGTSGPDAAINFQLTEIPSSAEAARTAFISLSNWTGQGKTYEVFADDGNFSGYLSTRSTNDTIGRFRITRVNDTFTFYTWNNNASVWIMESTANLSMSRALYVSLEAESAYSAWGAINASFNDFRISGVPYYQNVFNDTIELGLYNVTFYARDTPGAVNDTERTNFTVIEVNDRPSVPFLLTPPIGSTISGMYNITWTQVVDEENNNVWFNITLLNPDGSFNSTLASNYGDLNTTSFEWNTSNYADGNYSLYIVVFENDTPEHLSNSYEMTGNFTIDNTPPLIQFESPTDNSSTILTRDYILVNVSSYDLNPDNITVRLYNSSGGLINEYSSASSPLFLNITGLSDGLYYFNATAYDAAGNLNYTETRNVTIVTSGCVGATAVFLCGQTITESCTLNTDLFANGTCLNITSENISIDCASHTITGNGSGSGILVQNTRGFDLRHCRITTFGGSISALSINDSFFQNNTLWNSTYGFYMDPSYNNTIIEHNIYNNSLYGIYLESSNNNTIRNNTAYNNTYGFYITNNSDNNNITNNTAYGNSNYAFYVQNGSDFLSFTNNTARNSGGGFYFRESAYETLSGNQAYNNTDRGFYLRSIENSTVSNCTAYGNNQGFYLYMSRRVSISESSAYNNTDDGINIFAQFDSDDPSQYNNVTDSLAYGNGGEGIYLTYSTNSVLANNSAYANAGSGIFVDEGSNQSALSNNSAYNNLGYGIHVFNSDQIQVLSSTFHNNSYDYRATCSAGTMGVNLTASLFLNPYGTLENYTNLSIADSLTPTESYSINWTTNSSAPPSGLTSFRQKYVNISAQSGNPVIDLAAWHWMDSELAGYNDSKLELWKYNSSGWKLLNNTPDALNNMLRQYSMNPASEYGILSDQSGPDIIWINQTPADISSSNVFGTPLLINYNITDPSGVNTSSITIYYKTNSSTSDCLSYVNGTATPCGWQNTTYVNQSADTFLFRFFDNQIYPATYNFPERPLETTIHSAYNLANPNYMLKIEMLNVSNTKQYGMFEIMANTTGTRDLAFYYCNSSYTAGTVFVSPYCTSFYTLTDGIPYNHSHSNYSSHHVIPFSVNTTSGMLGGVYVTPKSYFIVRPTLIGAGSWNVYYISNVSRANATQTSTNVGVAWSELTGTADSHLHQYDGTDAFRYYVCALDNVSNYNCSSERYDYINLTGIPPTAPNVYSPTNITYCGNITISYTQSLSPNGYNMSHYNISLLNSTGGFNSTIIGNNSLNLSYYWNTNETAPGNYTIKVEACDVLGQCSFGYSEQFEFTGPCPASNCPVINTPGSYIQYQNYVGAPNSVSGTSPITMACIVINSDNVSFSCSGYNITNDATLNATGILINRTSANVTVENCPGISSYYFGLYGYLDNYTVVRNSTAFNNTAGFRFWQSTGISIYNNTAHSNTLNGFQGGGIDYSTIANNTAFNNSQRGFTLGTASSSNNFTGNAAYNNSENGILFGPGGTGNNILNNSIFNNSQMGVSLYLMGGSNVVANNTVFNNVWSGIYSTSGSNNTISENRAYNNSQYGIYIYNSTNNTLSNNTAYLNLDGVVLESSSANTLMGNTAYNNSNHGFRLSGTSQFNALLNNTAYWNLQNGFYLNAVANNSLANNTAYWNFDGFYLNGASFNNLSGNNASDQSYGFYIVSSNNNTISQGYASNNSQHGFYLTLSSGNSLNENSAEFNMFNGFYLSSSTGNSLLSNNATYEDGNGFAISEGSENNTLGGNIAHSNRGGGGNSGFYVYQSNLNNLTANIAYNNSQHGFFIQESNFTRLVNNTAYNNTYDGIQLFIDSDNNTLIGNTAFNNTQNGIWLDRNCTGNAFLYNSMYGNTYHGIYFSQNSSENTLTGNNMTENGDTGVTLASDVYSNSFTDNFICFNPQDIVNSSALTAGTLDYCDTWSNWRENGHEGCAFRCTTVWHRFYGQVNGSLLLAPNNADMFYTWAWNGQNGKLYALNGDAVIEWINLTALGRNTTGGNSTNDFTELDSLLGISAEFDNINTTYSYDGSNPKETADLNLFKHLVQYVPEANSSVFTSGFTTGIAWDASQGGTQFNTTLNQDVVFVSQINGSAANDYEIMVPGTLDTYKGGSGVVEFWVELD